MTTKFTKTTKRKSGGDDKYSWVVFCKKIGRMIYSGCTKSEAEYFQRKIEQEQ
jgi:hypothetical protein